MSQIWAFVATILIIVIPATIEVHDIYRAMHENKKVGALNGNMVNNLQAQIPSISCNPGTSKDFTKDESHSFEKRKVSGSNNPDSLQAIF